MHFGPLQRPKMTLPFRQTKFDCSRFLQDCIRNFAFAIDKSKISAYNRPYTGRERVGRNKGRNPAITSASQSDSSTVAIPPSWFARTDAGLYYLASMKCSDCKYWLVMPYGKDRGECRLAPPSVFFSEDGFTQAAGRPLSGAMDPSNKFMSQWPVTYPDDWCGEFVEKPQEPVSTPAPRGVPKAGLKWGGS
jgi:hypothetical protein